MGVTNFNLRLDQELRDRAFPVLARYGLSASQAIKLFLNQVAETNKVPLSFDYVCDAPDVPNAETIAALRQGSADYRQGKLKGHSAEEATQALLDEIRG